MSQALTTDSLNNPTVKGLNTDLASHLQTKEIWTYARNAVLNSHAGNMYALQNELSNIFCADLPYTFIGSIPLIEFFITLATQCSPSYFLVTLKAVKKFPSPRYTLFYRSYASSPFLDTLLPMVTYYK